MIQHLDQPAVLLGLVLAVVVGWYLHDAAQTLAASALGDAMPRRSGRLALRPAPHLDPYGSVAALLVGYGWTAPVPITPWGGRRARRAALALAAGPAAYLLLCVAGLGVARALRPDLGLLAPVEGSFGFRTAVWFAYFAAALFVTSVLPVPPLDGGRILFLLGPRSPGWDRARYQLGETQVGVAIVLALVLLPLLTNIRSVVEELSLPLWRHLGIAFGLDL